MRDLEQRPEEYGFFQAVRLLEIAAGSANGRSADAVVAAQDESVPAAARLEPSGPSVDSADLQAAAGVEGSAPARAKHGTRADSAQRVGEPPGRRAALGYDGPPDHEAVRLRSAPGLGFPAAEIRAFESNAAGPPRMSVNFLGMIGPQGVLPQHYTEFVLGRLAEKDDSALEFFDLFHHRTLSFFYRAWAKQAVPFACSLELEKPGATVRGIDTITRCLLALVGSAGAAATREDVPESLLSFYCGHLARQTRPSALLEQLLSEHFELPIHIEQFVGHWLDIPEEEQTRMAGPAPGSNAPGLGQGMSAGRRVWDVRSKVRVHAGPLRRDQFERIAPGTPGGARLVAITRRFLGPWIDFDLRVELAPGEVPRATLGAPAPAQSASSSPHAQLDEFTAELRAELHGVRAASQSASAAPSTVGSPGRLGQDTWLIGSSGSETTGIALFKID
jgi:type VI secretion system protein ImpH